MTPRCPLTPKQGKDTYSYLYLVISQRGPSKWLAFLTVGPIIRRSGTSAFPYGLDFAASACELALNARTTETRQECKRDELNRYMHDRSPTFAQSFAVCAQEIGATLRRSHRRRKIIDHRLEFVSSGGVRRIGKLKMRHSRAFYSLFTTGKSFVPERVCGKLAELRAMFILPYVSRCLNHIGTRTRCCLYWPLGT